MKLHHICLRTILFFVLFNFFIIELRAEFFGPTPTGLLELERSKRPYFLYVPPDYTSEKTWPLLVLYAEPIKKPKDVVNEWKDWARENHFLILVPGIFPREGTVPELVDRWLLRVKEEVTQRYRIDPARVLLAGFDYGAHYAAYLGLSYPEQFSAVALVKQAWPGSFEKLMLTSRDRQRQISFYLAMDPQSKEFAKAEKWAFRLEKNGYQVNFQPLKANQDFKPFRDQMLQWFRQGVEARTVMAKRPRRTTGEKIKGFTKDFFAI